MLKPTAFRLDEETDRMLDELARIMGGSRTAAVKLAIRKLHHIEVVDGKPKRKGDSK